MGLINDKLQLYLLVDRDDVTVKSAPIIQGIIDEKTNFKTDVLRMLEQQTRNCRYFLNEVTKVSDPEKDCDDINAAKYYLHVADLLLNQFLEERDTFLEIDNMPKGTRKYFNYEKEMAEMIKYSAIINNNKAIFQSINVFCLNRLEKLISEAKKTNTIPNYGALFSMDSNDIIKNSSIDEKAAMEYVLYEKPLELVRNCIKNENRIYDIIANSSVFYQRSEELIDYNKIHCLENVNWDAVNLVNELYHSGLFYKIYESSHHTGDRENKVKEDTQHIILPHANGFIGQRFHTEEHDAARRGRSSKIDKFVSKFGIDPSQVVLLDDSVPNCKDCDTKGGTSILYKAMTDSERINGKIENTGFNRITNFNDYDLVYEYIEKAIKKREAKIK